MKPLRVVALYALLTACARDTGPGVCADESWMLATTSGSPNMARCPHPQHRMRVQVASTATNEEAAAVAFCECVRDGGP